MNHSPGFVLATVVGISEFFFLTDSVRRSRRNDVYDFPGYSWVTPIPSPVGVTHEVYSFYTSMILDQW